MASQDGKSTADPKGRVIPSEDFATYCASEFERRRNADAPFDEPVYQQAMEMVLKKLRRREDEGLA
jgi:hypothetical protein